jgi:hypothetical protein
LTAPISPRLRWLTAGLLLAGAVLSLVLPFVSATFLTLMLGSAAVVAASSNPSLPSSAAKTPILARDAPSASFTAIPKP